MVFKTPGLSSLLAFLLANLWHCLHSVMDTKTLFVLGCLLAGAQARPAAVTPSSSCSVRCSGRNFWSGYKPGTTLQYEFQQNVQLKSRLSQEKSVLMQVKGQANFEVHSNCEMVLTVNIQDTKSSKSPTEGATLESKSLPKSLVDALKAPLRFAFEDGRVGGMCPGSGETRASLNFKRGLLSQLHLSIDRPNQEASIRENDVLGNCWTVYKQLSANKVQKTKDLSSCTNNFEVYPRNGVKYEARESNAQWPTIVEGNLKCTIELDGESMIIKENVCEENRVLDNSLGERGQGEIIKVETSLLFKQKMDSLASTLFEISDRSDLKHQHKTGDSCHDSKAWFEEDIFHTGNECLEKKLPDSGVASTDFKALAQQKFEALCQETRGNEMLNSTAAKYAEAIKYMRGITSQSDFDALFNWGKTEYCKDNSMFKILFFSALPTVGTRYSVKVMLNQLKMSDSMNPDPATANWLVKGIALMPHPTPAIIGDVLSYTKKVQADALMPTKDAPLALAAVTGRYCALNTDCATNEVVANVLTYFSDALGENCSKLAPSTDDPFSPDAENAFTALLSIGNIGRAKGGASFLIGCGENSELSLANRVFALRSLRRFSNLSTSELMRLGSLVASNKLDSELRITAYQAMVRYTDTAFWSDERAITKLSQLMQDEREDLNVQRYVYSHLTQWMKKKSRLTDSYTVSAILRDFERRVIRKSKDQGLLVSSYWMKQYKNPSMKSNMELESNIIYSSKSVMPRFINFNVTTESPISAEAVNMFELGVRMEGLEGTMEQIFNSIQAADGPMRTRRRRQAAEGPELTDEQKKFQIKSTNQRLDFFTRQNGMELTHINFDKTILDAVPALMKTLDVQNVMGLAWEKLSNFNFDQSAQSAGTQMETTISIPTISGFPILLKKEAHYLLNLALKQQFRMPSGLEMTMGLEVQPSASVYMARTVTVDAGFERAGLRSQTSGVTSFGVKLSLDADFSNSADIKFSYKVDPLKKRQKLLEFKTDIQFLQHRGPSEVVENPVVTDLTPVTVKCFTPASVKLFGRKMCLETNFERSYDPFTYVRQNPGSFRLYIDKNDTLGVYEASLRLKLEGRNANFTAVLGDQASPDRHAKFQFVLTRSSGLRKIIVELANPVLPIKWESESKVNGKKSDVSVALKFGTTDYVFRGARSRDTDGSSKLEGDFYRKDRERQKLNIVTKFQSFGFFPFFQFDFAVTTTSNDKITFNHLSKYEPGNLQLSFLASHEKENSVLTSIKSRLDCTQTSGERVTKTFAYNTEVVNKNGKSFLHSFTARVERKPKGTPETFESTVSVNHKFNYGVTKQRSVLDIEATLNLEETIRPSQLYKAIGTGSIQYGPSNARKTARLTKLRFLLGEDDVIDDHFNTKTFLLEYATELDGSQSEAYFALQALPLANWRIDNQCVFFKLNVSKTTGAETQKHAFELRHTSSGTISASSFVFMQVAKIIYSNRVLLDLEHKFYSVPTPNSNKVVFGHHLSAATFDFRSFLLKNEYSGEFPDAEGNRVIRVATAVAVNQETKLQLNQSLLVRPETRRAHYQLNYKKGESRGSVTIYSQDYSLADRQKSAMAIASYLRRARLEGFNLMRFLQLVQNFIYQIKMENGFKLETSSMSIQVTDYVDMTVTNGVMLNITRIIRSDGISSHRSLRYSKEVDQSTGVYRRVYKINVKDDDWEKLFTSKVEYKKSPNPQLSISFSRVSVSGSKSGDYNLTTVGRFVPQVQRKGQVAVQFNLTHRSNDAITCQSSLNVIVDTKPRSVLNPALNVTFELSGPLGNLKAAYNLGLKKNEVGKKQGIKNVKAISSELTITNTFDAIPFSSYSGINAISSNREQRLNFVIKKTLDGADLINFQTTLDSKRLYIGVKSERLPLKEVSYTATYNEEADGFMTYVSQFRFNVLKYDMTLKDNGRIKVSGLSGKVLFATVYSGTIEIIGLEQVIGKAVPMDRLDYNGKIEAKITGEFDTNMEVIKIQGETSDSVGLISAKFSVWPFEISSQMKTPLWNIGQYGFNISAGPKASENGFRFKAWIASPAKQSAFKYWHTYTQGPICVLNSEAQLKSDHFMPASSDPIKSTIKVTGTSVFDFNYSMNVTTPFSSFQRLQTDATYKNDRQAASLIFKMNDAETKCFDYQSKIQVGAKGDRLINTTLVIIPVWSDTQRIYYNMDAVIGSDYLFGVQVGMNGQKLASLDLVYVKSGETYPQLSRLSVPGAKFGFDLTYTGFQMYLLRTGDSANGEWKMKYLSGSSRAETSVTFTGGRLTAGSGEIFGNSITFSSPSEGSIEVTAASASGANKITWTSSKNGNFLRNVQIRFSTSGKSSCISYSRQGKQVDVQYGSCDTPNTIKLNYEISNIWQITRAKALITVEHSTNVAANTALHMLPGLSIPLNKLSEMPFKLFVDVNNQEKRGNLSFTSDSRSIVLQEEYDLSRFPSALRFKRVVKMGEGSMSQSEIINYDVSAKTWDIQMDMKNVYKLVVSKKEISLLVNSAFSVGAAYTIDEANQKIVIEFKGEWPPGPEGKCFLRLWAQKVDDRFQFAIQFQQRAGKEITIISDVTNYRYTANEFGMDVSTALSSSLIESLRSANSVIKMSYLQDPTNNNYTLSYQESFTAESVVFYEIESVFKGQKERFPSTFRVASVRGYVEAELSYNFNEDFNAESYVRCSMDKFADNRNSYLAEYRSKDVSANVGKYWRDLSLEFSSPQRQLYLSESRKRLENGTVQTEVQVYLNKRNMEGFTAIFNKDFTVPNVFKRSLQLTLPTRKVGYERVMKTEGMKLDYNLTVFWDMHSDMEKKIAVQFNREERKDSGYYYYHKLDLTAPFLKNKVSKEMRYERTGNDFQLSITHAQESNDRVTIAMNGKQYWDPVRSSMQKEMNISFAQQKNDVKANARIIVNSKRLTKSKVYPKSKYMTEVNIYATVPSKSIDSHVRIRSIPFEEFTFACNHGATLSYRYFKGFKRSRLSIFVSDSKKDAGQLTVTRDSAKSFWEATLDTGKGYMNPKSPLSFPIYKPTKVMVKVSAGVSSNGKKIHFGVLNGEMSMDSSIKLWKPDTIAADIDFFFVGAKLNDDNTLGYASHWRIRQLTKKSPFIVAKEVLVDPWAKARNMPISIDTINSLMRPVQQSQADNIDTDVVLDMLTSISSNDIDSLKRWAKRAKDNNEFMSNTIGKTIASAFYAFKGGVETWATMVRTSQYTDALPAFDTGIRSVISGLSDAASAALSRIPAATIWSRVLTMTKYAGDQIGVYFSAHVERLDNSIRTRISSLTGGSGSSILSIMYSAIASVYPVSEPYERLSRVASEYYNCIEVAASELISQLGKVVQPILVNTLGALPKVYDFFDNLAYERSQWRGYVQDLFDAINRDRSSNIEERMSSETAYSRNLAESVSLLLEGYYGRSIKQFFNTDANVVRTWRLNCDQACMDGGSFAAINGTIYLPFPASAFPQESTDLYRYRPSFYAYMPWWEKLRWRLNEKVVGTADKYVGRYSISGILQRMLTPEHRRAVVASNHIKTFGGKELRNLSPCRYLLAHDFLNGDFSIYQTYTWDGRSRQRGDLLIRFGSRRIVITNSNKIKLDGVELSDSENKQLENPKLTLRSYSRGSSSADLYLDTELRNVLKINCYSTSSCYIEVHPLYHGRLNGAFGSNDGNPGNDLYGGSASEHMRLWTAGMCVMATPNN